MSKKKSVFVNNLKTFKSNFTGEEVEYKINNALWIFMQRDFDLTQREWAEKYDEQSAYYGSIFATCLLNSNGYKVDFDEVVQNTDAEDTAVLIMEYQNRLYAELEGLEENEEEEDKENPS